MPDPTGSPDAPHTGDPARFSRPSSGLLTADQVADLLGMGVDWVYAQTRAHTIPHVRLGRYCRYRAESIQAWLADLEDQTLAANPKRPRTARTAGGMATGR